MGLTYAVFGMYFGIIGISVPQLLSARTSRKRRSLPSRR